MGALTSLARPIALAICMAGLSCGAMAHGSLHERIEALGVRIAAAPNDARLVLKRAELHRLHRDREAALADYDRAAALDPGLALVDLGRGMLHYEAREYAAALAPLTRFVEAEPAHIDARITRARVLERLGDPRSAAAEFDAALRLMPRPAPDVYIERAQALAAVGSSEVDAAIAGIEEGLRALGPLPALHDVAIDIERRAGRHDAALDRIDRVIATASRKERWLLVRGDVLLEAGRPDEARAAFSAAVQAVQALPDNVRRVKATRAIEERARQALAM